MERDGQLRINASLVNAVIRMAYKGGEATAVEHGRLAVSGLTDDQILKIARGEAELVGSTVEGVSYREVTS